MVRGRIRPVTCPSCGKEFSQHGFVGDFVSEFTEADFIEAEPA